jgi:hypothetical protein
MVPRILLALHNRRCTRGFPHQSFLNTPVWVISDRSCFICAHSKHEMLRDTIKFDARIVFLIM